MPLARGARLGPYEISGLLGAGGMGEVYRARDTRLGRDVAVKVIPEELAAHQDRLRRFEQEARLAGSLNHPNVLTLYDVGSDNGVPYLVTELLEGGSLRDLLERGPLPVRKAVDFAQQIARGLAAAHAKGVVHRDLKPGNVFVTKDGQVKILDFGLAKLTQTEPRDPESSKFSTATSEGQVVGTVGYMSPEQARGQAADARSDIFALGAVLYEMLSGRRAFSGNTAADTMTAILTKDPEELSAPGRSVPPGLEGIVRRCLEKDREDRFLSSHDLALALEAIVRAPLGGTSVEVEQGSPKAQLPTWALWGAAGLVSVLLALWGWSSARSVPPDPRTILVAPVEVLGLAEEDDYLGRAFAEAIAVNLAQSKDLTVLPVVQSGPGPAARASLTESARRTGAGRLLTGTLTREANSFHATINLIDSSRNRLVWGSQGDTDGGSLSRLASSLSREVAAQMGAAPTRLYDAVIYMVPSPRLAASREYADTQAAFRGESATPFADATQRLVAAFPEDVLAHAWHLVALTNRAGGYAPSTAERRACEAEASVLADLDPRAFWVDWSRGLFQAQDGNRREAIATFSQTLSRDDLMPAARAIILGNRAMSLSKLGEQERALADIRAALALDALSPEVHWQSSIVLDAERRYEDALAAIRRANMLAPGRGYRQADFWLGYFSYRLGRWKESIGPLRNVCDATVQAASPSCALLAAALRRDNQAEEARKVADKAAAMPTTGWVLWYRAAYHVLTRERVKAFELLRKSIQMGAVTSPVELGELETGQDFADLRDDVAFKTIVAEAGRHVER